MYIFDKMMKSLDLLVEQKLQQVDFFGDKYEDFY